MGVAVKLPFETRGVGDGYACPGPVTIRFLSEEEQRRYPPLRPTRREMEADLAAGLTTAESARKWGISCQVWVGLARLRGVEVKKHKEVDTVHLPSAAVESKGLCMNGDVAAEESSDKLLGDTVTPALSLLECLRRGLPVDQAQRMSPKDLTKEMVQEMLALGARKAEIMKAYRFRADWFYSRLRAWELASGPELRSNTTKKISAVVSEKPRTETDANTILSLHDAISRVSRLRENVEACARLVTLASEHNLATDDIVALLQEGRTNWETELDFLGRARVVI